MDRLSGASSPPRHRRPRGGEGPGSGAGERSLASATRCRPAATEEELLCRRAPSTGRYTWSSRSADSSLRFDRSVKTPRFSRGHGARDVDRRPGWWVRRGRARQPSSGGYGCVDRVSRADSLAPEAFPTDDRGRRHPRLTIVSPRGRWAGGLARDVVARRAHVLGDDAPPHQVAEHPAAGAEAHDRLEQGEHQQHGPRTPAAPVQPAPGRGARRRSSA